MSLTNKPQTIHDLKNSESRVLTVKEEVRSNLIKRMQTGDNTFQGIVGYRDTVIPCVTVLVFYRDTVKREILP